MGNCFGTRVQSAITPPNSGGPAATNESSGGVKTSEAVILENGGSRGGVQQLHAFTYTDLKTATHNFRPDSLLGEGGFGSVFKGHIDERTYAPARPGQGLLIAVKKLNPEGLQGHKEWLAELYFLGELHHPNLVKLIGYCCEEEHRLLVYEFLSRGSLENHLFGRSHHTLSWTNRLKIASDAARGLTFLHDAARPVIYRDFKTSNILLDSEFNAKLSDFGLAKDGPTGDKTHVTTRVMGTYGYAAPEYVATGRLTAKSDVYGFGVVLLEVLTGRRAVDKNRSGGEQNLVEWAGPYLADKRKWSRVLDQKLDGQYSLKGAQKAASLALQCLNQDAKLRPTMKQVLESLESILGPKDLSKLSSNTNTPSSSKPNPRPLHPNASQDHTPKQDHKHNPKKELSSNTNTPSSSKPIPRPLHPNASQDHTPKQDHKHNPKKGLSSNTNTPSSSKPIDGPLHPNASQDHTPKQDHKHKIHTPKKEHKLVDPPQPANAFKLPSPKPRQDNKNVFPSPSPTRAHLPRLQHN